MEEFLFQNGRKCPQLSNRILLVDDDEDDQLIFLSVVKKVRPALNCTTAWNGIDAMNRLSEGNPLPEIVFLDLNMPLMNGHQFLAEAMKDPNLREIPIVVLSTSSHFQTQQKTLELGASHFLTKPSSLAEWELQLRPILTSSNGVLNPATASRKWMT
jgi:CheY-like chemotaxis protein